MSLIFKSLIFVRWVTSEWYLSSVLWDHSLLALLFTYSFYLRSACSFGIHLIVYESLFGGIKLNIVILNWCHLKITRQLSCANHSHWLSLIVLNILSALPLIFLNYWLILSQCKLELAGPSRGSSSVIYTLQLQILIEQLLAKRTNFLRKYDKYPNKF